MSKTFFAVLSCLVVESVSPRSPTDHQASGAYPDDRISPQETKTTSLEVIDSESFGRDDSMD